MFFHPTKKWMFRLWDTDILHAAPSSTLLQDKLHTRLSVAITEKNPIRKQKIVPKAVVIAFFLIEIFTPELKFYFVIKISQRILDSVWLFLFEWTTCRYVFLPILCTPYCVQFIWNHLAPEARCTRGSRSRKNVLRLTYIPRICTMDFKYSQRFYETNQTVSKLKSAFLILKIDLKT